MFRSKEFQIVGLVMALIGVAWYFITTLTFEYDLSRFYPKNNSDLSFYRDHSKRFGADDNFLLIAFPNEPDIFETQFLNQLDSFTQFVNRLPYVDESTSLTNHKNYIKGPLSTFAVPYIDINKSEYSKDSLRIITDPTANGWLLSTSANTAVVHAIVKEGLSDLDKSSLIDTLEHFALQIQLPKPRIGGQVYTEVSYVRMLMRESIKATLLALGIVVVLLVITFRSVIGILIPAISVLVGLVLLFGYIGMTGRALNILCTLFPTLMCVVGMSDLIHIFTEYQSQLRSGIQKKEALKITIKEKGQAIMLTSLTTAIGFIALTTSGVSPVRLYGIDGAVGVLIAFLIAIFFTPALLNLVPQPASSISGIWESGWDRFFKNLFFLAVQKSKTIITVFAVLLIVSGYGISTVSTNHSFTNFATAQTNYSQNLEFINSQLGGSRIFDLSLEAKAPNRVQDLAVLQEIEKLHNYLDSKSEIGSIFSPSTLFKNAAQLHNGGDQKAYSLPSNQQRLGEYDRWLRQHAYSKYQRFVDKEGKLGRLFANMQEMGRLDIEAFNGQIQNWIDHNINPNVLNIRFTGYALLLDKQNEELTKGLFFSLAIAFLCICIIMAFLFKDLSILIIAIIPNIFPLIMIGGVLGIAQIPLSSAISLIFTLGFVIAVDDTIHFLTKFRWELEKSHNKHDALLRTFHGVGKPIVITSVIMIVGYASILVSEFNETYYHGLLISLTLFFAVIADLTLLPALIHLLLPNPETKYR